jgi:hypothetical protein
MEAMQLSWPNLLSWQFGMWHKRGILLFGQGYATDKLSRLPDEVGHSSGPVSMHARPWGVSSVVRPKVLASQSTDAYNAQ